MRSLPPQNTVTPPVRLTMERTTQTENKLPKWRQFLYCLKGDDKFRKQREREAATGNILVRIAFTFVLYSITHFIR